MNKAVLTISQNLVREGELVIMPRKEYDRILGLLKKKIVKKIDDELLEAVLEVRQGKISGSFSNTDVLIKSLES